MKKMNNKGFSLVELIIVIAIMAILIGVLAPQYIKYVEKSRVSADKDLLDSVYTACTTAAADPDFASSTPANSTASVAIAAGTDDWGSEVLNTLGVNTFADVTGKLKSKAAGSTITVSTDANGNFTVTAGDLSVPDK
ncbi:MAG: prepilin-type N-terminal cleavage/methylation domain-containing protein [Lachnospiraceae bacterium]|nr:prepilin-type N-terminal cleavage/methylation domain-containing protein [Lachnospiraceae bacterium]